MGETEETKKLVVRFKPHVYQAVKDAAALAGVSFNTLVNDTMEAAYGPKSYTPGTSPSDVLNHSRALYASSVASNAVASPTPPVPASFTRAVNALAGLPDEEDHR